LAALETVPTRDSLHIYPASSLTGKNGNAGAGIYYKLFNFYLPLGEHSTHFDGETEAVTTALIQLFGRTGCFEKAVKFSDSVSAIQSVVKFYALPSKRVWEPPTIIQTARLLPSQSNRQAYSLVNRRHVASAGSFYTMQFATRLPELQHRR
jgi:hypothetical protein